MSDPLRHALTAGKAVLMEMPAEAGGGKLLVVEIEITCPDCGHQQHRFAGHHLKAIRDLVIEWIDQFPELCGGEHKEISRTSYQGTPPTDPSVN